ncbi:MAG TPA: serine hydrolase, partial [Hanamia sp.]|nr:serine hydrolase [Hanamia sp.]
MKNIKLLLLLFIFSTLTVSIFAQPLTSNQIDALVERTMKTFDVPGIAVAVVKDGKIIHEKGYGVRSLNTMQKVDEHTLFGIA